MSAVARIRAVFASLSDTCAPTLSVEEAATEVERGLSFVSQSEALYESTRAAAGDASCVADFATSVSAQIRVELESARREHAFARLDHLPASETKRSFISSLAAGIRRLVNPLFVSVCLGMVVGLISPIKDLLHPPHGDGSSVSRAIDMIGSAHIPIAMILVGNVLSRGPLGPALSREEEADGSAARLNRASPKVVSAIVFFRLIVLPAINYLFAYALLKAGVIAGATFFIAAIVAVTPTASIVLVMHQAHDFNVHFLAPIYFYEYLVGVLTLTTFCVLALVEVS